MKGDAKIRFHYEFGENPSKWKLLLKKSLKS